MRPRRRQSDRSIRSKEPQMIREHSRREFLKRSSLLAALGSGMLETSWARESFVEANTSFGRVRGTDVEGIKTFKGIPYGATTAGRNRFMPPLDPAKWTGVRDALEYGPSAPQREPGVQSASFRIGRGGRRPAGRRRGLPRAERLDAGRQRRRQAARDAVVSWRRFLRPGRARPPAPMARTSRAAATSSSYRSITG